MGADQDVTEFNELIDLVRGMRGQMVEAQIFLPWDANFPIAEFSGTLDAVEYKENSHDPRWVLAWGKEGDLKPVYPRLGVWERRFVRAELSFTGDPDEGLLGLDETQGHNIFLKIHFEGWDLELTSYV